ncbi:hypothetical protein JCM5350_008181 [Sporobolomyces pararoseus]
MNSAILPAPLHLRARKVQSVGTSEAHQILSQFLSSDSSALLSGSGAVRASLVRLTQGLKDELEAGLKEEDNTSVDKKKRRKSDKGTDGEGKKRRKVDA